MIDRGKSETMITSSRDREHLITDGLVPSEECGVGAAIPEAQGTCFAAGGML